MRALLLGLLTLGSLLAFSGIGAPSAAACPLSDCIVTLPQPCGLGGCLASPPALPVGVCLGFTLQSPCGRDVACVSETIAAAQRVCVENNPL